MHSDPRHSGQRQSKACPNPLGQHFAGWILQTHDLIEVAVIQLVNYRGKCPTDFREVTHPTGDGIDGTGHMDHNSE